MHIRVCVMGCGEAGTTSVIRRFVDNTFTDGRPESFELSGFTETQLMVEGINVLFEIVDLADDYKSRGLCTQGHLACIVVYDCSNVESPKNVYRCFSMLDRLVYEKNYLRCICGNKSDLGIKVTDEAINEENIFYPIHKCFIVSAKNNEGIEDMFREIALHFIDVEHQNKGKRNKSKGKNGKENGECVIS